MGEIENYNFEGLCQEEYCDKKYTHVIWERINNRKYALLLCEDCHEKIMVGIDEDINIAEDMKNAS